MSDSDWTRLANYDFGYEADYAEAALAEAGIPVLVKGREAGIWGPGAVTGAAGRLEEHQIGRRAGLEAKKSLALTAARR